MPNCLLCNKQLLDFRREANTTIYYYECKTCGKYKSEDFENLGLSTLTSEQKAMVSAYTRELFENNLPIPELHALSAENQIDFIIARYQKKTVIEKLYNLIFNIGKKSRYFGQSLYFHGEDDYPITYSVNSTESDSIKEQGLSMNYFKIPRSGGNIILTWKGWSKYEEIKRISPSSKKCFVAMACRLINVFRVGIEPVLVELGFEPIFIEREEHNQKIDDLIISEIRASRFLIADVTDQRQNVYYEAGYAQGLGLDVIWTCKDEEEDKIHFDTRQFNHIIWENEEELKNKLRNRIKATII